MTAPSHSKTARPREDVAAGSSPPNTQTPWLIWQLLDSAFPVGGFGHSGGLEAAFQSGFIIGEPGLVSFLGASLRQLRRATLPFVCEAFRSVHDISGIMLHCDAFLSNHVANRASRLQGRAFLAAIARVFKTEQARVFQGEFEGADPVPCHYAPIFGALLNSFRFDLDTILRMFVFVQVRGWISAAVRLGIIGPLAAQGVQFQLARASESATASPAELTLQTLAQTAPLLDLLQGSHDRIYSRLFQS